MPERTLAEILIELAGHMTEDSTEWTDDDVRTKLSAAGASGNGIDAVLARDPDKIRAFLNKSDGTLVLVAENNQIIKP